MAEPHTPRSLIVTFYGAYGRAFEGPVPVSALVRLVGAAGVDAPAVRSSVSRLKRRGFLLPARAADGSAGYALSGEARQLLDDGDRRIYGPVRGSTGSTGSAHPWLLAVFSVPEQERSKRHLLRSRLAGLGFGAVAPGVWIAPAHLYEETGHTLDRLRLTQYVDLFRGPHLGFAPTAEAVARWWELPALAKRYEDFLDLHEPVLRALLSGPAPTPQDAYRRYLPALDTWRRLPYADPGLPRELLPADWPGDRAAAVFDELHTRLRDLGSRFARP
ncbi:PaaX family transcriptional regulator C-terminal domain-containing protein [Streptomyces sp. NPDC051567]|uniref:PaaX family transcriptional regulator n=1 Tax=Streptomyces sp. NPDC051567 TaxID=3365660 RepID=UPI0037BAA59B